LDAKSIADEDVVAMPKKNEVARNPFTSSVMEEQNNISNTKRPLATVENETQSGKLRELSLPPDYDFIVRDFFAFSYVSFTLTVMA
jgi:hypothetical protein